MSSLHDARTFVVVGHGRSPEERGWGIEIDYCEVVIRMWNWHWQDPKDYGVRYDYGLFDMCDGLTDEFWANNKHEPTHGWLGFLHRFGGGDRVKVPERTTILDPKAWFDLAVAMGGHGPAGRLEFTRGSLAACWAITQAKPHDRVVLVGFDYVVLGKSQPVEQAASPVYLASAGVNPFFEANYAPNVRRYGFTDYGIEYPLLQRLADMKGVRLVLAQAIWP